jgi:hypothetical protein
MNAYEERYYKQMLKEIDCIMNLCLEIEGKMIDHNYDTAIERCYDMIRSLQHMKRLHTEKRAVDMLHVLAKNALWRNRNESGRERAFKTCN